MPLSGPGAPTRSEAVALVHSAFDAGVRLIDTADAYCTDRHDTGHNEELVAEALRSWPGDRDSVLVATKGGHVRGDDGGWAVDGRPERLRAACDASLRRLRVESIGLYQFHRPDPAVPFAESAGALADLLAAGKVRHVGLSNVDIARIDAARGIVPIASVQNQCSPDFPSSLPEAEWCEAAGIAFLAWAPLGGAGRAGRLGERHTVFADVGVAHGVSAQRVALAWLLAHGSLPIPAARRTVTLFDSLAAADLHLSADEVRSLDRSVGAPDRGLR